VRLVGWVSLQLCRLLLFVGGISIVGLLVATVAVLAGEDQFPAPFSLPEPTGYGTYAWQVAAIIVVAFVSWRVFAQVVIAYGSDRAVFAAMGREHEYDRVLDAAEYDAYLAQPPVAACSACGREFRSWDEALDHADHWHGDRPVEDARALLARYEEEAHDVSPVAKCAMCETYYRTWDDALDHAQLRHGHDRLPEEARALLVRLDGERNGQ
jgi:hypothetical protein